MLQCKSAPPGECVRFCYASSETETTQGLGQLLHQEELSQVPGKDCAGPGRIIVCKGMEKAWRKLRCCLSLCTRRRGHQVNLPCSSKSSVHGRLKYYLGEGAGFPGHALGMGYWRCPGSGFVSSPSSLAQLGSDVFKMNASQPVLALQE